MADLKGLKLAMFGGAVLASGLLIGLGTSAAGTASDASVTDSKRTAEGVAAAVYFIAAITFAVIVFKVGYDYKGTKISGGYPV